MKQDMNNHFNELSPTDIIDTMELNFNEEEERIFSDAVLLAQQYNKYINDFKNKKRDKMVNKDNITWYKRFIHDILQRPELIAHINNKLMNKIEKIIEDMNAIGLQFFEECLLIDQLYEKTIEDMAKKPLKNFYEISMFIGECTKPKKKYIKEKINDVPEKSANMIMF